MVAIIVPIVIIIPITSSFPEKVYFFLHHTSLEKLKCCNVMDVDISGKKKN